MHATRTAPTGHAAPAVVEAGGWRPVAPATLLGSDEFLLAALREGRRLPAHVHDALAEFTVRPHRSGALLVRGVDFGDVPATPATPTADLDKDATSEFALLTIASVLGHPVGYLPEHGGDVVQNIVPVRASADRQVSTSSKIDLMFHTEAAFHPHRPRYLLLACLRGDADAHTTLSSILEVVDHLPESTVRTLRQPRFRTAIDESYLHGRQNRLGEPMAVLQGTVDEPTLVFDEDLMVGSDPEADEALRELGRAVRDHHTSVALEAGDVLVVDNFVAVHGRTPFSPRYDGTDRWLQRSMVVADLAPSASDRRGRIITTVFGD